MLALVQDTSSTRTRPTTMVRCPPRTTRARLAHHQPRALWSVLTYAVTKAQASAVFEVQPASGGAVQYIWMVSRPCSSITVFALMMRRPFPAQL